MTRRATLTGKQAVVREKERVSSSARGGERERERERDKGGLT